MRTYAAELVSLPVEVIVEHGSLAVAALQRATQRIPIVFVRVTDPVDQRFVSSLAHPGGNVTGFTSFDYSMIGKWFELLKEIAPYLKRMALLFDPETDPYAPGNVRAFETAAPSSAVEPIAAPVHGSTEIEHAIAALAHPADGGLIVLPGAFADVNREEIVALAARYGVPTIYGYRYFTAEGGLISYGILSSDGYRRAAEYVDRSFAARRPRICPSSNRPPSSW